MILEYVKKKKKPTQRQYVKGTVMQAIFFDIVLPTEHKGEVTSFVPLLFSHWLGEFLLSHICSLIGCCQRSFLSMLKCARGCFLGDACGVDGSHAALI